MLELTSSTHTHIHDLKHQSILSERDTSTLFFLLGGI